MRGRYAQTQTDRCARYRCHVRCVRCRPLDLRGYRWPPAGGLADGRFHHLAQQPADCSSDWSCIGNLVGISVMISSMIFAMAWRLVTCFTRALRRWRAGRSSSVERMSNKSLAILLEIGAIVDQVEQRRQAPALMRGCDVLAFLLSRWGANNRRSSVRRCLWLGGDPLRNSLVAAFGHADVRHRPADESRRAPSPSVVPEPRLQRSTNGSLPAAAGRDGGKRVVRLRAHGACRRRPSISNRCVCSILPLSLMDLRSAGRADVDRLADERDRIDVLDLAAGAERDGRCTDTSTSAAQLSLLDIVIAGAEVAQEREAQSDRKAWPLRTSAGRASTISSARRR